MPHVPTATTPVLAEIAHCIGEVDRVLVLGTDDLRTALEREIVAIGHRPETIRDAVLEGPVDEAVAGARRGSSAWPDRRARANPTVPGRAGRPAGSPLDLT